MKKTVLLLLLLAITITSCMAQRPARHNGGVILGDLTGTSSDPTATKVGQIYWNDTNKEFRTWNGTAWKSLNDIEGISSSGATYNDLLLDFGGIGFQHPSFRLDHTTKQISFYSPLVTGENIIIDGGLRFDRYKIFGGTSDQVMLADGTFASLSGMGGSNIFTADGVTPDSSTRFLDLGANSNFYLRNSDYSNYIFFNNFNLELRNSQGGLRFRTGTGGTVASNSVGDVWTATSTVGDGHWATPSGGGSGVPYTGAISDVDLNAKNLTNVWNLETIGSAWIKGGNHLALDDGGVGSSTISTTSLYGDVNKVKFRKNSAAGLAKYFEFDVSSISNFATSTLTIPNTDGVIAIESYVDGNFVDLTSNQTKTGVLSFNNTSGVSTNGISIENSSATGTSYGLKVLNSNNSFDGQSGVLFENTGIGYAGITSIPSGNGGGHYILSNSTYTGTPLKYQKTGGNSFTVDANANVTANSFIGDGSGLTNLPNDFSEFMTSTGTRALSTLVTTIGDYDASGEGLFISIDQATPMIQLNGGVNLTGGAFNLFDAAETYATSFPTPVLTANRTLTMPDASGTIALTSNISGLETLDETNGIGRRLISRDATKYGNIGLEAIDFSFSSGASSVRGATGNYAFAGGYDVRVEGSVATAFGIGGTASGDYSAVFGNSNTASGTNSFSVGSANNSTGQASASFGNQSSASGLNSFASGSFASASGAHSFAIGTGGAQGNHSLAQGNSIAYSYGEVSLGLSPTTYTPSSVSSFSSTDRIFNIGNGVNASLRDDAFTVLKNGKISMPSAYGTGATTGTATYSLAVDSSGNIIEEPLIIVSAPATATSTGTSGQIAYDSSYFYVCTATNTWVRTALSTW